MQLIHINLCTLVMCTTEVIIGVSVFLLDKQNETNDMIKSWL